MQVKIDGQGNKFVDTTEGSYLWVSIWLGLVMIGLIYFAYKDEIKNILRYIFWAVVIVPFFKDNLMNDCNCNYFHNRRLKK